MAFMKDTLACGIAVATAEMTHVGVCQLAKDQAQSAQALIDMHALLCNLALRVSSGFVQLLTSCRPEILLVLFPIFPFYH